MSIPTTWTELMETRSEHLNAALDRLPRTAKRFTKTAAPLVPADALRGVAMLLSGVAALRGVTAAKQHADLFLPHLPAAVESVTTENEADYVTVDGVVWFVNLSETAGFTRPDAYTPAVRNWIDALATPAASFERPNRHSLAFSALAFEDDARVPDFLGEPIAPNAPPGATFQFDYPSLIAYIAAACRDRATPEAVQPAWLDFLQSFPYKLATEAVEWPVLFTAGRIVYHRIGGLPVENVAREVHKQIMQLIGQGK